MESLDLSALVLGKKMIGPWVGSLVESKRGLVIAARARRIR
jgi:hypothetical protein